MKNIFCAAALALLIFLPAAARAGECLNEALDALKRGMTFDAVTVSLEGAVSALLDLTGERATNAVVDRVFSQFCVGK